MTGKPLKVLIAEDEYVTALHISSILNDLGYEVSGILRSGEEILSSIRQSNPDMVLMDVKLMGEMDGIEAAQELKKAYDMPVIYVTAYSDDNTLNRIKGTEPYGYLLKPINADALKAALEISYNKYIYDKKLKESEQRYMSIVENLPILLCRFMPAAGYISYANPFFCEAGGRGFGDLKGECFYDYIPESQKKKIMDIFQALSPDSPIQTIEYFEEQDGVQRWYRHICQALFDEYGNLFEFQFISEDISEIKLAQKEIQAKTNELQKAVFELNCLYSLTQLAEQSFSSLDDFFARTVPIITASLEMQGARSVTIRYGSKEFSHGEPGQPFESTEHPIIENDRPTGTIIVNYGKERSRSDSIHIDQIFMAAVARRITEIIERIHNREQLRRMEREIIDISEKERQNVGRELHDVLGQQLTGISFLVKTVLRRVSELSGSGIKELDEIADLVHDASVQCRKLSKGMLLSNIDGNGLIRALDELASNTRKMFKINCELLAKDDIVIRDNFLATQIYRIIQEAVNNSLKHSRADNILIMIRRESAEILAEVRDDGTGLLLKDRTQDIGSGLEIMKYRANLIGGQFSLQNHESEGVSIIVRIPAGDE